jgi:hypothetical protein
VGGRGFVEIFQKEHEGWGGGGGGERRIVVESHQNNAVLVLFFFFFFKSNKGIFVILHTQNDIVLGFSSIFTMATNGGGHFIRGW